MVDSAVLLKALTIMPRKARTKAKTHKSLPVKVTGGAGVGLSREQ